MEWRVILFKKREVKSKDDEEDIKEYRYRSSREKGQKRKKRRRKEAVDLDK